MSVYLVVWCLYSDHGPVNTWDRVPYITTVRNGSASIIPAFNEIDHNFILGTYNTQEGILTTER